MEMSFLFTKMPIYLFMTQEGNVQELFYKMSDAPSVGTEIISEEGVKLKRIFTIPTASVGTSIDPYSPNDFMTRFENKKVTVGDMFDESAAMSAKRASKDGKDPIKQHYLENYKKDRKGQAHSVEKKEKFLEKQKEFGISIDMKTISGR